MGTLLNQQINTDEEERHCLLDQKLRESGEPSTAVIRTSIEMFLIHTLKNNDVFDAERKEKMTKNTLIFFFHLMSILRKEKVEVAMLTKWMIIWPHF